MMWIWAAVFVLTLVLEIISVELISLWFSIGALAAFILALCGVSTKIQIIVFLVVSVVLTLSLRWVFMKLLKNAKSKTNLDEVVGKNYLLVKSVSSDETGEIKVNDVIWRVVSKNGESIEKGERVKVVEVSGNKFVVEKASDSEKPAKKSDESVSAKSDENEVKNKVENSDKKVTKKTDSADSKESDKREEKK